MQFLPSRELIVVNLSRIKMNPDQFPSVNSGISAGHNSIRCRLRQLLVERLTHHFQQVRRVDRFKHENAFLL
jgi:hypothetical protein